MDGKLERAREIISSFRGAVVAFSGGVDSTLVLKLAAEALGERALAATVNSPLSVPGELERARELAAYLGVRHVTVPGTALNDPVFRSNPPERCYICKRIVYATLGGLAAEAGAEAVLDGANADDAGDYRPGLRAAREMGVRSPLLEAGLTKSEIRALVREAGLPNWDRPAQPCLATRIPYGELITEEKLETISAAEQFLAGLGFSLVRVRHHGTLARLELLPEEMDRLGDPRLREEIDRALKDFGFSYVTADLGGFKSGSLNALLAEKNQQ